MNAHCMICKKPLSDFTSIKIGMGPVCRARIVYEEKLQRGLFMDDHAVFAIMKETGTFIYIKDTGHNAHKSVTNDAGYVIETLAAEYGIKGKRVFYMDSDNNIDELVHNGVSFVSFRAGHAGVEL